MPGVPRPSRSPLGAAALLFVLLLALPAPAVAQGAPPVADLDWAVQPLGGEEITLERFRGEVLFVNLWATWCKPCVAELGSIAALQQALADEPGVRFLLVAPERERTVRRFVRRHGYADLPLYLERQRMPVSWGLRALPTTWVVDRGGRIVLAHRGAADWNTPRVRALLRTLARER